MITQALKGTRASRVKHWYDGHEVTILIGGFILLWAADHVVRHIIIVMVK